MTEKTPQPQDTSVELDESKLDQATGGGRGQPVGGISDGTSNISDGTSNISDGTSNIRRTTT